MPLHETLVDRYPGVDIAWVMPPSRLWLGEPIHAEHGGAVLLDDSCGIYECCGVMASITVGPDHVVWSDLFARGRPSLPAGLRFELNRADYEAALDSIAHLPPTQWCTDQHQHPDERGTHITLPAARRRDRHRSALPRHGAGVPGQARTAERGETES